MYRWKMSWRCCDRTWKDLDMDGSLSFQLVDGEGVYNGNGLENFARSIKLAECGVSYAVVSVMGPKSSGKSTLLNHLFGTSFREMNASEGRFQTTKGIWMAKCVGIEPCTIVMDLEGTDGRERGEDDTNFERQSALFAVAVSDIVLINMWCHDIGREHAANKPLLKTVFQVMMRLFSSRRTTLLFVIRDKTKTPPKILEHILREDIQKIWDAVPKPQAHKETPLSDFFIVEVVALSSYAYEEEEFKEQVASLRERFLNSIAPGGLAEDRRGVVPASEFCYSSQEIWSVIKENKDLHLPTLKVMLATFRCKEIANEKFASLRANESWHKLEKDAEANYVPSFGKKLSDILDSCLSGYDLEVTYFDDTIKTAERQQLESKILQLVHSAYLSVLGHLQFRMLDDFKVALDEALNSGKEFAVASRDCSQHSISVFDEECADAAVAQAQWDPSEIRDRLKRDIDAHITAVHFEKNEVQKEKLKKDLEKFSVERTVPYGHSNTGRTFDIMDLHSIKIIEIGHGSWIDSLKFQYTSDGNLHWTPKVGGDGGGGARIELNDGEYITQVKGEYALKGERGGIITNLKFSTSHDRKFGPYGVDYFWKRNVSFVHFKVQGRIVGFHGTAGIYLSSIGFYRIG